MSRSTIHDAYRAQIDALLEKNQQLRQTIRMLMSDPEIDRENPTFQQIHTRSHAIQCLNGISCGQCNWCNPPPEVREPVKESGVFRVFKIVDNGAGKPRLKGVVA